MSLRAQAALAWPKSPTRTGGRIAALTQAVNAYDRIMGPATAEAQLFNYWLLSTQLKQDPGRAGAHAMLAQLDPRQIALADPREDWKEKAASAAVALQLAQNKKILAPKARLELLHGIHRHGTFPRICAKAIPEFVRCGEFWQRSTKKRPSWHNNRDPQEYR